MTGPVAGRAGPSSRFRHCRRGIAALEFALVLPLMLTVLYGTAEFGNALLLDRKMLRAANTGADVVAQARTISGAELDDILLAMREVLKPFGADPATLRINQVWRNPDNDSVQVDWSVAYNATALASGSGYELPQNLVPGSGDAVIVAEVVYRYEPLFGSEITGPLTIRQYAYLKPRRTTRVSRT